MHARPRARARARLPAGQDKRCFYFKGATKTILLATITIDIVWNTTITTRLLFFLLSIQAALLGPTVQATDGLQTA